jgi:hypothetical protein
VRFEILYRLNLPVGGNHAANWTALHGNSTHFHGSLMKIGIEQWQ